MMWGYTMFPSGGFSTKPYYISRIEDKNGNVLARFDTERKEVISQNTAYTMCRMMQGTVDIGTAQVCATGWASQKWVAKPALPRITPMPGLSDIPHSYWPEYGSDAMTILSGWTANWEKADASARPIWEYFYAKTAADKDVGLNRKSRFVQPENMKSDMMYDYESIIDKTPPPGAEGDNQGNGNANQYLDTSSPHVPVDSKPFRQMNNVSWTKPMVVKKKLSP